MNTIIVVCRLSAFPTAGFDEYEVTGHRYKGGTSKSTYQVQMSFQYFLKIVSTELIPLHSNPIYTNQYSFTMEERALAPTSGGLPGVFFMMDISPMQIIYRQNQRSLINLITGILGIAGGIFIVAGLVDGLIADGSNTETYVIGIAGGSGSGKTSVAERILKNLNVPWVVIISMDSFYDVLSPEQSIKAHQNNFDFDHPSAFERDKGGEDGICFLFSSFVY
ncbi:endoplasmic reticulum vesicle transporter-domain-containing protein [Chlamydoabsidia padenii]|nr:endoplasmic reticulum vesicle transporter-domain-containing protein [Chlamydoabsidia padenii]